MKNINLLPTEKPSRLGYLTKKGKEVFKDLRLFDRLMPNILDSENQNIYITSDEEIKEGDWFTDSNNLLKRSYKLSHVQFANPKKIILTTDPELIADGVQAIDDEFLNWFVKNPSCECVEIERMEDGKYIDRFADGTIKEGIYENYKIIIPQEEPKQETLNKINNMGEEIKKQINLLEEEQTRVKQFINENNFNCTTAPWVIAKQYRDEIKKHIGILKMNLEN